MFLVAFLINHSGSFIASGAELFALSHFVAHFLENLIGRLWYAALSFHNICRPHKITLAGGRKCIVIYLTIGFPCFLIALLLSALGDTPLVPLLGFPFFLCGFLRPKRDWASLA